MKHYRTDTELGNIFNYVEDTIRLARDKVHDIKLRSVRHILQPTVSVVSL